MEGNRLFFKSCMRDYRYNIDVHHGWKLTAVIKTENLTRGAQNKHAATTQSWNRLENGKPVRSGRKPVGRNQMANRWNSDPAGPVPALRPLCTSLSYSLPMVTEFLWSVSRKPLCDLWHHWSEVYCNANKILSSLFTLW
jgi:hypothetical protein